MLRLFGFKNYFDERRKQRFVQMSKQVRKLSDTELKSWYMHADERKLLRKIEEELEHRGFKYMTDY